MPPIKAVVTDFAGVLVADGLQATLKRYETEQGIPNKRLQEVNRKYWIPFSIDKITEDQYWQGLLGELDLPYDIAQEKQRLRDAHAPSEEMFSLMRRISTNGTKIGLLTNNAKEWFEYFDEKFGLSVIFDATASSHECGYRKPDPPIYHMILRRIGTSGYETLFIDDQPQNLDMAERVGIETMLYTTPESTIEVLKKYGVEL